MSVTSGHETLATSKRTANQPNRALVAVSIKPVHSVIHARSTTGLYVCIQQSTIFPLHTQCEFTFLGTGPFPVSVVLADDSRWRFFQPVPAGYNVLPAGPKT